MLNTPRDKAIAQIRQLFCQALLDTETRRNASRETFCSPDAQIGLVQEASEIEGSESVFRRINKAGNLADLIDCTTEIHYALVFDALGFRVEFVRPGTKKMPDLLVSRDDKSSYVEVKRIRPDLQDLPPAALEPPTGDDDLLTDLFESYGGEEDGRKIEQELRGKFRQVRAVNESNTIIATWSDREAVEELDFRHAVRNIRRSPTDPYDGRPIPDQLLFCVFGWFWINCGTGQQLYCEPVCELTEPFLSWMAELEQARP